MSFHRLTPPRRLARHGKNCDYFSSQPAVLTGIRKLGETIYFNITLTFVVAHVWWHSVVSKHTKYVNHCPRSIFHFSLHGTGYKKLVFAFVPHDVWLFWGHFQAMEGLHARWNLTALVCSAELTCVCEIRIEFNSLSFFFLLLL